MSKKTDFLRSVREMSETDLRARVQEDRLRLKKLQFAHAVSPIENPMNIRELKKDIARLNTELKNKQSQAKEVVPATEEAKS